MNTLVTNYLPTSVVSERFRLEAASSTSKTWRVDLRGCPTAEFEGESTLQ